MLHRLRGSWLAAGESEGAFPFNKALPPLSRFARHLPRVTGEDQRCQH
jgi:hypothetical protein